MSSNSPRNGDMGFLKTILESPEDGRSSDVENQSEPLVAGNLVRHESFSNLNEYIDGVADLKSSNDESVDVSDEFSKDGRISRMASRHDKRQRRVHKDQGQRSRRHSSESATSRAHWNDSVLDNLGDRLEHKYAELQGLLHEQLSKESSAFVKHQVDQAKRLVKQYALASRGLPTADPVTLTYVPDSVSPRSDCGTQTDVMENLDDNNYTSSVPRTEKHVSFAKQRSKNTPELESTAFAVGERESYAYRGILKKSRERFHGKKFIAQVKRKQSKSEVLDVGDVKALQEARLKDNQQRNKSNAHAQKPSSNARIERPVSAPSPRSKSNVSVDKGKQQSEYNLKDTDDPLILGWIHRKNVERRKTRSEKREKRKIKRQEKHEEAEQREKRKEESAVAMQSWLEEKRKQVLLLKKRAKQSKKSFEKTHAEVTTDEALTASKTSQGTDLASPKSNKTSPRVSPRGSENTKRESTSKASEKTPRQKCSKNNCDDALRCSCGYLEAKKQREMEERQAEQARKAKQRAKSASRPKPNKPSASNETSQRAADSVRSSEIDPIEKPKTSNSNKGNRNNEIGKSTNARDGATQKPKESETRMSYDEWLAKKRKQDQENKVRLETEKKERLNKSDPELVKIIPDLAKRRVDNILNGKKKVDTGIDKVDEAANAYPSRPSTASPVNNAEKNDSKQKYMWRNRSKMSEENQLDGENTESGVNKRPSSARHFTHKQPQTAKLRPMSAKPNFSRPTPPRSASSPTPRSKIDNITHISDNPFKIPFPPGPKKPSRLHEQGFRGRQFATYVWDSLQDEERPEPQGSDNPHPVPHESSAKRQEPNLNQGAKIPGRHTKEHERSSVPSHDRPATEQVADNVELAIVLRTSDTPSTGAFMTSLETV